MQNETPETIEYAAPTLKENVEASLAAVNPSPDNPPWNSFVAVLVWLMSIVFIAVVPLLFVFPYLMSKGLNLQDKNALTEFVKNDPTTILLSLVAVIPAHILTLALAWAVVTNFKKFSFRETLGWRWNKFNFWTILIILGGFFIVAAAVGYFLPEQETELARILASSRTAVYIVAFLATFTAPIVEEVIYRGVLYSAFQRSIGVPAAVGLTTVLFAAVHVPQYWGSPGTIILICLLSLVLTIVRARTENLLPCIALHTAFNGVQSLFLIFSPYIENAVKQHSEQGFNLFGL